MDFTEIQEAWLQALESDKWEQGEGQLAYEPNNGPTQFCCLGVGCELLKQNGAIENYDLENFYPTSKARDLMGWKEAGDYDDDIGIQHLAAMNDEGASFGFIAAEVRAHPERYFVETIAEG